ncbi:uncharacterized protein [Palaemon carinicauda]|uniref:uncharacterized protein isoform X2 n=1 Tax=Palaemon carinicauda TaxID=392227 RepID=UPI0035B572C5
MGGQVCCANNCTNSRTNSPEMSFFKFPNREEHLERCKKWVHNLNRKFIVPELLMSPQSARSGGSRIIGTKRLALCEDHFTAEQFMNPAEKGKPIKRKHLRPDAVPTVFDLPKTERAVASEVVKRNSPKRRRTSTDVSFPGKHTKCKPIKRKHLRPDAVPTVFDLPKTERAVASDVVKRKSPKKRRTSTDDSFPGELTKCEGMPIENMAYDIKTEEVTVKEEEIDDEPTKEEAGSAHSEGNAIKLEDYSVYQMLDDEDKMLEDEINFNNDTEQLEHQEEVELESEEAPQPLMESVEVVDKEDTVGAVQSRHITLPKKVERDLGEWLQNHPYLYDRGAPEYKNIAKKKRTITEKARSMTPPLTYKELTWWLRTKRTRFGQILTKMDRSDAEWTQLTAMEKWIYNLFSFMEKHIQRQQPTRTLGLHQRVATAAQPPTPLPREPVAGPSSVYHVPRGEDISSDKEVVDLPRELGATERKHIRVVRSSNINTNERTFFDKIFNDPLLSVPDTSKLPAVTSAILTGQRMAYDPLAPGPFHGRQAKRPKIFHETQLLQEAYNELESLSQSENGFTAFGTVVANNLNEMNCENQIYAKKLVLDVIFLGRLGRLSSSTKIVE